jgi:hypothetical protein
LPRQIQLNDGQGWERLRPGQFVVFLSDARTDVVLDSDGKLAGDSTCIPVFESMVEAEAHAEQAVERMPSVCAAIYDHRGRSGDPLRRIYHRSIRSRFDPERSARRYAWIGGCLLVAFAIWAVIAAYSTDEHFLWFYILGVKLFVLGAVLFVRGIGFFLDRRRRD